MCGTDNPDNVSAVFGIDSVTEEMGGPETTMVITTLSSVIVIALVLFVTNALVTSKLYEVREF